MFNYEMKWKMMNTVKLTEHEFKSRRLGRTLKIEESSTKGGLSCEGVALSSIYICLLLVE